MPSNDRFRSDSESRIAPGESPESRLSRRAAIGVLGAASGAVLAGPAPASRARDVATNALVALAVQQRSSDVLPEQSDARRQVGDTARYTVELLGLELAEDWGTDDTTRALAVVELYGAILERTRPGLDVPAAAAVVAAASGPGSVGPRTALALAHGGVTDPVEWELVSRYADAPHDSGTRAQRIREFTELYGKLGGKLDPTDVLALASDDALRSALVDDSSRSVGFEPSWYDDSSRSVGFEPSWHDDRDHGASVDWADVLGENPSLDDLTLAAMSRPFIRETHVSVETPDQLTAAAVVAEYHDLGYVDYSRSAANDLVQTLAAVVPEWQSSTSSDPELAEVERRAQTVATLRAVTGALIDVRAHDLRERTSSHLTGPYSSDVLVGDGTLTFDERLNRLQLKKLSAWADRGTFNPNSVKKLVERVDAAADQPDPRDEVRLIQMAAKTVQLAAPDSKEKLELRHVPPPLAAELKRLDSALEHLPATERHQVACAAHKVVADGTSKFYDLLERAELDARNRGRDLVTVKVDRYEDPKKDFAHRTEIDATVHLEHAGEEVTECLRSMLDSITKLQMHAEAAGARTRISEQLAEVHDRAHELRTTGYDQANAQLAHRQLDVEDRAQRNRARHVETLRGETSSADVGLPSAVTDALRGLDNL